MKCTMLIDDFSDHKLISKLGTQWRGVSDKVMGGISDFSIGQQVVNNRTYMQLAGDVSLENNGGFIQAALDLEVSKKTFDASNFSGIRLTAQGNGEQYSVHLRTPDNVNSWQSYRAHFTTDSDWKTIDLPFTVFAPYRLDTPLDVSRLRRIGIVAIGRAFHADIALAEISFMGKA